MTYKAKLYKILALTVNAYQHCIRVNDVEWRDKHQAELEFLVENFMPSGSGVDNGVKLDEASHDEKLIFNLSYHHMDENGFYDGWTDHRAIVTPSLAFGYSLKITGTNRNEIKEYLADTLSTALDTIIDYDEESQRWYSPKLRDGQAEFAASQR